MSPSEPIAIIGSGCRFPGEANTPSALWEMLHSPPDLLLPIPEERFSTRGFYHESEKYHGHTNVRQSYLLSSDNSYRYFDAQFFGISPAEANAMDPQMRLLLETVYEALEDAGQTISGLQGSNTAVYTGLMTADYEHIMGRDEDSMGTYHVTGTARSLMSNRISYFFDWHGPSMTIDTACSSSLYGIHYAVQQLRSGASRVAVAAGSNLLLDPIGYIGESKLRMLSPGGRSRMWDADADGYARGEGVAAIVLKTLSDAEKDGDHIECVIRETAINQDGRTKGLTIPNATAQTNLIRECYERAGLDINQVADRPQFFEAHGTGTPMGDPLEAEAIRNAFFNATPSHAQGFEKLRVGSVKTVIGHTEATAGLAGIMKASLAIQNSTIPPNLLFNRLNPNISPFYSNLQIPTKPLRWPSVPEGSPRRASINSFGFGGANAHAILESYKIPSTSVIKPSGTVFCPFIFSAGCETSLVQYLESFSTYLKSTGASTNMRDLAYTLHSRRTRFPYTATFSASTTLQLSTKIDQYLEERKSDAAEPLRLQPRANKNGPKPRILAVFTGQGAQWACMGARLISESDMAHRILLKLQARLDSLPVGDRPSWKLAEELQRPAALSRVNDAELSQPLCTAIGILLVDILAASGIELAAVIGHSSGEIAAAYAAGILSAEDAICLAYYRGLYASMAQGPGGESGAMLAVASSADDMNELLEEPEFQGRACIAAVNSSSSVTLSGDDDVIMDLNVILKDEGKFARPLRVDKAYHSHHMAPCGESYLHALEALDIKINPDARCMWYSSVYEDDASISMDDLKGPYWNANLQRPVLFKQAIERAYTSEGGFDLVVEVGPHPALKAPGLQVVQDITGSTVPYTGVLGRGIDDIEAMSSSLGYISRHTGDSFVDFHQHEAFMSGASTPKLVKSLPLYNWNRKEYWHESRLVQAVRRRTDEVNELLGHLSPDSTEREMRWRHFLRPNEIPWLKGHQLQNQMVFPAAGYVSTALEACKIIATGQSASTIQISNLEIGQALIFDQADSSIEILFSVTDIRRDTAGDITACFTYNAATGKKVHSLDALASGEIRIHSGDVSTTVLPVRGSQPSNLIPLKSDDFYGGLAKLEYQYSGNFVALRNLKRKAGAATGSVSNVKGSRLLVHPAMLDAAFQSVILTAAAPDDGSLWSMHVPKRISNVMVNPALCTLDACPGQDSLAFDAFQSTTTTAIAGDVDIFSPGSAHAMIQIEGLECVPFAQATAGDDKTLFSSVIWGNALPNASDLIPEDPKSPQDFELASTLQRMACYFLRKLIQEVPDDHISRSVGPYVSLFKFAVETLRHARSCGSPLWEAAWDNDNIETITMVSSKFDGNIDVKLLRAMGQNLADIAMNNISAIEIGMKDNLLAQYYQNGLGMREYTQYLAKAVQQLTFQSSRIRCLEIGAGTGGATRPILEDSGHAFASYTFTDISSGFFESAHESLGPLTRSLIVKTLDITKDPLLQGFEEQSYDLIVASMVLHATPALQETLKHVRSLLRPGGYLVILEGLKDEPARIGTMFGTFPDWWAGSQEGRDMTPCVSLADWDDILRNAGFSGCDTVLSDEYPFIRPLSIFISQAVDDRVAFMRDPLINVPTSSVATPIIQDLVLLGGGSLKVAKLTANLEKLLRPFCGSIKICKTLANLGSFDVSSQTTVLSLVEIDRPTFTHMNAEIWSNLKSLFQSAGTVQWITQGRRCATPHAGLIVGMLRSVVNEIPGLEFQSLDIEDEGDFSSRMIAEFLLRFRTLVGWKNHDHQAFEENMFVAIERELVVEKGGRLVIPRLVANDEMNERYNSSRREIFKSFETSKHVVSILPSAHGYDIQQELDSSVEIQNCVPSGKITHSLLAPVRVAGNGRLFLALGTYSDSQAQFVSFSEKIMSAVSPNTFLSIPVTVAPGSEPSFLYITSLLIQVSQLIRRMDAGDRLLVHEPNSELIKIISEDALSQGVSVTFTASNSSMSDVCYPLLPNSPMRSLEYLGLDSLSVFLNLAHSAESRKVSERIKFGLSEFCRIETLQADIHRGGRLPSSAQTTNVLCHLHRLVDDAQQTLSTIPFLEHTVRVIEPQQIFDYDHSLAQSSVVDWSNQNTLSAKMLPIDQQTTFSSSKTYWLAGLSGSLGLSLCQWMIHHGARYVVISSRTPLVEDSWLKEVAVLGAVVKICACDITIEDDVKALYAEISSTMPAIAGVAHGAMVLEDTSMSEMSLDTFEKVTKPKVSGGIHLSKIFQQHTLDFFILFSSTSLTIGTPGQSAYVAANMFMSSLAEQRRKQGLAASVINIGPIVGVGYIAQQQLSIANVQKTFACMPMSEHDFHVLFAEAILAGRPRSTLPIEITSGVRSVQMDEGDQPIWAVNPLMSHFIMNGENIDVSSSNGRTGKTLKSQLLAAKTHDEVHDLIKEALLAKLVALLQLDSSTLRDSELKITHLDELGLDSLMATEIRAWLLKHLQVNYPVLKILSGISILKLVEAAVNGVPSAMIPGVSTAMIQESEDPESFTTSIDTSDDQSTSVSDSLLIDNTSTSNSQDEGSSTSDSSELILDSRNPLRQIPPIVASFELSSNQSMFYAASQLFEDDSSLNFMGSCLITGLIDLNSLERATNAIGQQHEALRTCFISSNGHPMQGVMEKSVLKLEHRVVEDEAALARETARMSEELSKYHFDIEGGEVLRLILISSSTTNHRLVIGTSHICMDGMSFQVFLNDLFRHYIAKPSAQRVFQYQDYVMEQIQALKTGSLDNQIHFWKLQYPDFPPTLPVLNVSRAKTRQNLTYFCDDQIEIKISPSTKAQIQSVCRSNRSTPFHFYLACFRALLSRHGGSEDVSIGIADANRAEDRMMNGIGVFNNILPLRFHTDPSAQFGDVLQETRRIVFAGLENAKVPFQALLERLDPPRSSSSTPIFQCSVNYRQGQRKKEKFGEIELELLSAEVSKSGYDLSLDINDDPMGDCLVALVFRRDLYLKSEADILLKSFEKLLTAFSRDPGAHLDQPQVYEQNDIMTALTFSRGQVHTTRWDETVVHRIDHISRTQPDTVAINDTSGDVTYKELHHLAMSMAAHLLASGAASGSRIATLQEPSVRWIASVLAIMRIGATYVPLYVETPRQRLAKIVGDCKPDIILIDNSVVSNFQMLVRQGMSTINVSSLELVTQETDFQITARANDPAIILYTSGSTGAPKGITLRHEGIRNWIEPTAAVFGIGAENVMHQSACNFDMSLEQMLFALCFGGCLHLVPRSLRADSGAVAEFLVDKGITFTIATPTEYSSWLAHKDVAALTTSGWKRALSGGEHVTHGLLSRFKDLQKVDLQFFNSYGPTETTIISSAMEIDYANAETYHDSVPAGFPLPNYTVYIVDERLHIVPPGVQGEIYIGGPGVAVGYVNDSQLTTERFVTDIFAQDANNRTSQHRMHRTGDLGRWRQDGGLLIEGRVSGDTQIKLRGIRMDLREIENSLLETSHGSFTQVAVTTRRASPESAQFLVAYVVFDPPYPEGERPGFLASLGASLHLPKSMCPAMILPLSHLPRTSSGKLDRKAISALPLEETIAVEELGDVSLTDNERRLRDIWITVILDNFKTSRPILQDTDFFHIGGTSLLLLSLQKKIQESFGVKIRVADLLEASTLKAMARLLQDEAVIPRTVNWSDETRVGHVIRELEISKEAPQHWSVVILTGSTGFLGRHILKALIADDTVTRVHCIGVRSTSSRTDLHLHDKVRFHEGDLVLPRLGLTEDAAQSIFSKSGCVIHCGAQVSHSQSYHSLRLPNLQSTKELARMCLPYRVPLHFVSTAQVGVFYAAGTGRQEFPEVSSATFRPPEVGFEGYSASKWASECFLESVHQIMIERGFVWPVLIHRPTMISRAVEKPEQDVIHSIQQYALRLRAVPAVSGFKGFLDTVDVEDVVSGIVGAVKESGESKSELHFCHYFGKETLPLDDPRSVILAGEGDHTTFEELPLLEWARRAEELGMHPHVVKWIESAAVQRQPLFPKMAK